VAGPDGRARVLRGEGANGGARFSGVVGFRVYNTNCVPHFSDALSRQLSGTVLFIISGSRDRVRKYPL